MSIRAKDIAKMPTESTQIQKIVHSELLTIDNNLKTFNRKYGENTYIHPLPKTFDIEMNKEHAFIRIVSEIIISLESRGFAVKINETNSELLIMWEAEISEKMLRAYKKIISDHI